MALTDTFVKQVKHKGSVIGERYADGGGMYLRVKAAGKYWRLDYPDVNLPVRHFTNPEEITSEDIERGACECRDLWRLGRSVVQDLALVVEGAGVIVVREETGIAQIEGLSAWSKVVGRPLIPLSADKDNGYRSRFDLAHELGHLVLHRHIVRPTDRTRSAQPPRKAGSPVRRCFLTAGGELCSRGSHPSNT